MVASVAAPPSTPPNFNSGALNAGWFLLDGYDGNRYVETISGWALVRLLQTVLQAYFNNTSQRRSTDFNAFREGGPWENADWLNRINPQNYNFRADELVVDGKWSPALTAALWRYVANRVRPDTYAAPTSEGFDAGTLAALDAIEQTFVTQNVNPTTMVVAIWVALEVALGLPWSQVRRIQFGPGYVTTVPWMQSPEAPVDNVNRQLAVLGVINNGSTTPNTTTPNGTVVPDKTPGAVTPPAPNTPTTNNLARYVPTTTGGKVIAVAATVTVLGATLLAIRKLREAYA